ncbi:probable phytanoyl-CoA dioxygenase [Trichoplusia ni]|uniref:phytanoyl-CoA dioxygenase n=1 Tax=Trichoplusia ni TaxID=7111 RepID=A0A7E5WID8_TRINI|nr:probable phytanoyl-CoA dioxygenase [Trichoplusia ni]
MANKSFKAFPNCVSSPATYPLTAEQLQFYRENGYLVIRGLISQPALNSYRQRFKDVCNGRVEKGVVTVVKDRALSKTKTNPEDYINKIQELLYDEVYSTYSEDPRLLHIVSQLVGSDHITAVNCMLINKPPGTSEHPPHQDLFYFPFRPAHKIVGTWTAVDPVDMNNGCLYMVPGSHKPNVLYDHGDQINDSKLFFTTIVNAGEVAPEHRRVYLEMAPGDTVFFAPDLVHGSRPNISQGYRKAMTCHYASSECWYIDVYRTNQARLAEQMETELRRRGGDLSYVDLWRIKTKQVRGVRSNL